MPNPYIWEMKVLMDVNLLSPEEFEEIKQIGGVNFTTEEEQSEECQKHMANYRDTQTMDELLMQRYWMSEFQWLSSGEPHRVLREAELIHQHQLAHPSFLPDSSLVECLKDAQTMLEDNADVASALEKVFDLIGAAEEHYELTEGITYDTAALASTDGAVAFRELKRVVYTYTSAQLDKAQKLRRAIAPLEQISKEAYVLLVQLYDGFENPEEAAEPYCRSGLVMQQLQEPDAEFVAAGLQWCLQAAPEVVRYMDHSGELGRILLGIQNDPKSASPVLDDVKALLQVLGTSAAEESGKRHRDAPAE